MRPRSAWDKSQKGPDDKGSKGPSGKRPRGGSLSHGTKEERPTSNAAYSDRSSPAGGQTENADAGLQVSAVRKSRASSAERTSAEGRNVPMDDASAAVALQKAIQASPHKFRGTHDVPIELGDLTPQPTRRLLFPSPSKSQEGHSKCDSRSGSVKSPYETSMDDPPQADKENCPPPNSTHNIDDVPDSNQNHRARATTPTPLATSTTNDFKTPLRTPNRRGPPPTTGDFFSSAAKALLRPDKTLTPKRTPTRKSSTAHPLEELSPFTAHLNQLLSDPRYDTNNNGGNDSSPASQHSFSFPSLPSLHNTPGRPGTNSRLMDDFDFSAFDSQDLISTDVPMPSSPPAWFGVYEDADVGLDGGLWGDDALPTMTGSSPLKAAPATPMKQKVGGSLFGDSPSTRMVGRGLFAESPGKRVDGEGPLLLLSSPPLKDLRTGTEEEKREMAETLVADL